MNYKFSNRDKKKMVIIIITVCVLRIILGQLRPITYSYNALFDDYILLKSSDLQQLYSAPASFITLVKTLSFSWFLDFVGSSPFSLDTMIAFFWIADSFLMLWLLWSAKINWKWCVFGFIFVLFCPSAFENEIGVRLYRNILIAPTYLAFLLLLSISFVLVNRRRVPYKQVCICYLLLALLFPFSFYPKEDGEWMKMVLMFFMVITALIVIIKRFHSQINNIALLTVIISLCIPLTVFYYQENRYKEANYTHFGYPYITTRTDGELYKFVKSMYLMESDDRNIVNWAPKEVFKKAVDVSPTLQNAPDFTNRVLNESWILNGEDISGDFLAWTMLIALYDTGNFQSPEKTNEWFSNINNEVEEAFESGELKKDSTRFRITSQSSGRTFSEILQLFPPLFMLYYSVLFLPNYKASVVVGDTRAVGGIYQSQEELDHLLSTQSKRLKSNIAFQVENSKREVLIRSIGVFVSNIIFWTYRILTPFLFFVTLFTWIKRTLQFLFYRSSVGQLQKTILVLIFILIGISFVYGLALIWFSQFLYYGIKADHMLDTLTYYGPGMIAMIYPAILLLPAILKVKNGSRKA